MNKRAHPLRLWHCTTRETTILEKHTTVGPTGALRRIRTQQPPRLHCLTRCAKTCARDVVQDHSTLRAYVAQHAPQQAYYTLRAYVVQHLIQNRTSPPSHPTNEEFLQGSPSFRAADLLRIEVLKRSIRGLTSRGLLIWRWV